MPIQKHESSRHVYEERLGDIERNVGRVIQRVDVLEADVDELKRFREDAERVMLHMTTDVQYLKKQVEANPRWLWNLALVLFLMWFVNMCGGAELVRRGVYALASSFSTGSPPPCDRLSKNT